MQSVKYYVYSIQGNKSLFSSRTENSKLWLCRLKNSRPEYVKESEQVYRQLDPSGKQTVNIRVDQRKLFKEKHRERIKNIYIKAKVGEDGGRPVL